MTDQDKDQNGNKKDQQGGEAPADVGFSAFGSIAGRRGEGGNDTSIPLWLITFSDVMALMLTFFVLLYSMAVPEEEEWSHMTTALNTEFNKFYNAKWQEGPQETINIEKLDFSTALDLNYLTELVKQLVSDEEVLKDIVLIPQRDRLIVSLPHELLFDSGAAEVRAKGKSALFALGGALSRIRNRVEVMGHADPRPVQRSGGTYASNWELSLARAVHVAALLESVGYRRPITVRGVADSRYDELPATMSEEERLDLSRRVDVIIMEDDGSQRGLFNMGG